MSLVISTTEEVTEVTTVDDVTTVNVSETPVVVSEQVLGISGPKGDTGATGATGATGPSGVVSVTAPITNSGTSTAAIIGINAGVANGVATLDGSGLVPTTQLPPLAVNDTFVVASQAAMLALTAQVGDIAVRTDVTKTFILTASPASTLGNWQEILTPPGVTSVTASSPLTGGTITSTGTIGIQSASTTQSGAVQLNDTTSSTSTTQAATANIVRTVNATLSTHTSSTGTSVHGATSTNSPGQIVARDASGNFSAGTITATGLTTTGPITVATTTSGTLTIGNASGAASGKIALNSGNAGGTTTVQNTNGLGVSNTVSLPTSTTTLVGRDTQDTLTNKTLTSPVISSISNTGTLTLPTSTGTVALTSQIPAATFPPFVSTTAAGTDQLYKPASPVSTTAFTPVTGTTYYLPFYVGVQTTFDRIGFTQSGAGSGNVRLGIYNDGGGYPTTVLADAGQVAYGTASTTYTATFSTAQTLAIGWYWLAWNRQSGTTGTFFQLVSGNSALGTQANRLFSPTSAGTFGSYTDTSSGTGVFVTTSLGVLTASGNMPLIYLRAQ